MMRAILAVVIILLAGCVGFETGQGPGDQDAYFDDDPTPNVTNDGFYDGGVFDQDMLDREPGQPQ